jgi:hypothetical protein
MRLTCQRQQLKAIFELSVIKYAAGYPATDDFVHYRGQSDSTDDDDEGAEYESIPFGVKNYDSLSYMINLSQKRMIFLLFSISS